MVQMNKLTNIVIFCLKIDDTFWWLLWNHFCFIFKKT